MPRSANRVRHIDTVGRLTRYRRATALLVSPSAKRKTICARRDSDAGKLCERAIDSNCARSAIVTFSSVAGLPTCIPEYSKFQGYSLDSTQHAKLHMGHHTSPAKINPPMTVMSAIEKASPA